MIENRAKVCIACGNSEGNELFLAYEKMFGLGDEFTYLNCKKCSSLQIVFVPENLDRYYSSQYYTTGKFVKSNALNNLYKRGRWQFYNLGILKKSSKPYINWIKELDIDFNSKIADIGCGSGQLLYEMLCSGFKNLHGFDPYVYEEINLKGLSVKKMAMDDIQEGFDVVMMHHSFEHMAEPKRIFDLLSKLVKTNGELLIRTPVSDAKIWEEEGINWFQIDAPRHLFIPSVKAMLALAQNAGVKIKKVIFDSDESQFLISKHYKNGGSLINYDVDKIDKTELKEALHKSKIYNEEQIGDQACFYFTKA